MKRMNFVLGACLLVAAGAVVWGNDDSQGGTTLPPELFTPGAVLRASSLSSLEGQELRVSRVRGSWIEVNDAAWVNPGTGVAWFRVSAALISNRVDVAKFQIHNFSSAIEQFYLSERKWPRTLEDLTVPNKDGNSYLKSVPMDPWKQPYSYNLTNDTRGDYQITSGGPDGQVGPADDIVYESTSGKFRGDR